MRRIALILLVVLVALAASGLAWWSHKTRIDPFKELQDRVTGYGAGHERHRFPEAERIAWDPIGKHNARVAGLDPEQAAYPLLASAARMYAELGFSGVLSAEPGDPEWERLTEALATPEAGALFAELVRASHKMTLGMPMLGQSVDTMPFEHPASLDLVRLRMERLLVTDAFASALSGNGERFRVHIEAALRLQLIEADLPLRIAQTRRRVLVQLITQRIGQILNRDAGMVHEQAASSIDELLGRLIQSGVLLLSGDAELIFVEDIARRMMSDRGVYDPAKVAALFSASPTAGSIIPPPSSAPTNAFTPSLWRAYEVMAKEYERALAASVVPWDMPPEGWLDVEEWMNRVDSIPGRAGRMLTGSSMLGLKSDSADFRTTHQSLLGLRVALAAHRHQLRHGQPPSSLDTIDPDLMPFDPIDGFTGGRLVYRWTGESHLVYALGADHDDDAGRHPLDPEGEPVPFISDDYLTGQWDGDWVVFPPRE